MRIYDLKVPPASIEISANRLIHLGPALIVSLQITESGSKGTAVIYDGGNTNGVRKATLKAIANYCFSPFIGGGIECLTGIYATVNDENTSLRIEYYPAREEQDPV